MTSEGLAVGVFRGLLLLLLLLLLFLPLAVSPTPSISCHFVAWRVLTVTVLYIRRFTVYGGGSCSDIQIIINKQETK